jgi:hypothetical protein
MATKLKTPVGELRYVFIKGEGRNQAMPGQPERMQFVASVVLKKDSAQHKQLLASINTEWDAYKSANGLKPAQQPKTNGIKPVMDKETGAETDYVLATFKTNTKWADGKPQVVKVFDHKGNDITVAATNAPWSIGSGSTGVIHGSASGNDTGGAHKVTLYLTAVQIAKLVKYEGDAPDVDEMEGEDIDLGDDVPAITEGDEAPAL